MNDAAVASTGMLAWRVFFFDNSDGGRLATFEERSRYSGANDAGAHHNDIEFLHRKLSCFISGGFTNPRDARV
jgi:hypothetical protein